MITETNFFYLNIGNRWPGFRLTNLEIAADGALQLRALPRLSGQAPENLSRLPIPQAPAGMARTDDGTLFFTEPDKHRLWRIDPCDLETISEPSSCIGGEGSDASKFRFPRGLLFLPGRGLLIADSGNHRLQIIDPISLQVLEIWDGVDRQGNPLLNEPWALVMDKDSNIYVVAHGDRSLQKLDRWGRVDSGFRAATNTSHASYQANYSFSEPAAIAVVTIEDEEQLLVLDRGRCAILIFDLNGRWRETLKSPMLQNPLTLAVSEHAIYIGDNDEQHRTVLQFDLPAIQNEQLNFVGKVTGYRGPIAALFVDHAITESELCQQRNAARSTGTEKPTNLLLLAGNDTIPFTLKEGAGYLTSGHAIAGPFDFRRQPVTWHRLQAIADAIPQYTHASFYFRVSESPDPPATGSLIDAPFSDWCAFPKDVTDGLFASFASHACRKDSGSSDSKADGRNALATATYLWLGLKLSGDGSATPRIHQIRVQFNHETYLPHLPALYSEDKASREFLTPLLSLFESFFIGQETAIASLPALFDPAAARVEFLEWLAGWLAQDLKEDWSADHKRRLISEAYATYAWRGTAAGLRQRLLDYAGVQAHIIEPLMNVDLWSLGETSTLGFDTMLASAEAQGAVLGTTATLDRSHLITNAEFGAPLFTDVAHRFVVMVYQNAVSSPQRLVDLHAIIERDQPAHTVYQLCVIQPALRIGLQSTVGIDTVVAGPSPATPLTESSVAELVLAGKPLTGLGQGAQIGVNTRLY